MAEKRTYEISLEAAKDSILCSNPTITFEKPNCPDIKCDYKDGKIVVEYPADCPLECVYAIVDCGDECAFCEPERVEICPCVETADCPGCHDCIDNLCVSRCEEDETCVDGRCVECESNEDCPCNQICVNGDCQCPADKPQEQPDGCCSDCQVDEDCPNCGICTSSGCQPKDCGDFYVDPDSCECTECVNNGHCGTNECCVGGSCDCCQGFIRNAEGNCVLKPVCEREEDCPECFTCVDGTCVPTVCPPGYICVNDNCVLECNCDAPDCPGVQNCVEHTSEVCYCNPCFGNCDENSDCGDGCYCDNGECKPNPCYSFCADGDQCGDGCGCVDGICYPCDSLPCDNTCATADGCHCVDGINCEESPCKGSCINGGDCGEGCGCFRGQCVPCADIPCDNCLNVLGCECIDGVNCVDSPCDDQCLDGSDCDFGCGCLGNRCVSCEAVDCVLNGDCPEGCYCDGGTCKADPCYKPCSTSADCDNGCDCEGGVCVSCSECDNKDRSCNDRARIFKDDSSCDLVFEHTTDACCECPGISLGAKYLTTSEGAGDRINVTFELQLRKGSASTYDNFLGLDLLSETGIDNDLPENNSRVKVVYTQLFLGRNEIRRDITVDFADTDTREITFTNMVPQRGNLNGDAWVGDFITVEVVDDITFENGCRYDRRKEYLYRTSSTSGLELGVATKEAWELTKLEKCRNPLVTWYKSEEAAGLLTDPDNIIRRAYTQKAPRGAVGFTDRLIDYNDSRSTGDYRLETCHKYGVRIDCGCTPTAVYSCDAESTSNPTNLTFCHPTDFEVSVDPCSGNITFTKDVTIDCDVLQHEPTRPVFEILANGEFITDVIFQPNTNILIAEGTILTNIPDNTQTVTIKPKCDECGCGVTKSVDPIDPLKVTLQEPNVLCPGNTNVQFISTITGGVPGSTGYEWVLDNGGTVISSGTSSTGLATANFDSDDAVSTNYKITVTDSSGCEVSDSISFDYEPNENFVDIQEGCNEETGKNTIIVTNNTNFRFGVEILNNTLRGSFGTYPLPANGVLEINTGNPGAFESDYIRDPFIVLASGSAINCTKSYNVQGECGSNILGVTGTANYSCEIDKVVASFQNNGPANVYINVVNTNAPGVVLKNTWVPVGPAQTKEIRLTGEDVDNNYQLVAVRYVEDTTAVSNWERFFESGNLAGSCALGTDEFSINYNCTEINGDCTGCTVTLSYNGIGVDGLTQFDIAYKDGANQLIGNFSTTNPNGFILEQNANISNGRKVEVTTDVSNANPSFEVGPNTAEVNCADVPNTGDCNNLFASSDCDPNNQQVTFFVNNFEIGRQFCASINGGPVSCTDQGLLEISTSVVTQDSVYELTYGYTEEATLNGLNNNSTCKSTLTEVCVLTTPPVDGDGTGDACEAQTCLFRVSPGFPATYTPTLVFSDGQTVSQTYGANSQSEITEFYTNLLPNFIQSKSGADDVTLASGCDENGYKYTIVNPNTNVNTLSVTVTSAVSSDQVQTINYACGSGSGVGNTGTCETDICLEVPLPGTGSNPSPTLVNVIITESDSNDEYAEVFSLNSATDVNDFWNRELPTWIEGVLPGSDATSFLSDCAPVTNSVVRRIRITSSPTELSKITFEINGVTQTSFFNC